MSLVAKYSVKQVHFEIPKIVRKSILLPVFALLALVHLVKVSFARKEHSSHQFD